MQITRPVSEGEARKAFDDLCANPNIPERERVKEI